MLVRVEATVVDNCYDPYEGLWFETLVNADCVKRVQWTEKPVDDLKASVTKYIESLTSLIVIELEIEVA